MSVSTDTTVRSLSCVRRIKTYISTNDDKLKVFLDFKIFYCQKYTIGLNTSFTFYIKFSPVSYKHRSDREHDG
jgi:hypothetical protein